MQLSTTSQAFDEIKNEEDKRQKDQKEYKNEIDHLRKDLEDKIQKIFEKIDISILS